MAKKPVKLTADKQTGDNQPLQIYELKITLRNSNPPIWRRIAVAADICLSDLHRVIQVVMGWDDYHLHQFLVSNTRLKLTREELASLDWQARYERLTLCRNRCWSDPQMGIEGAEDEYKMRLCDLVPAVKSKFIYEYDFGDSWNHQIEVVKIGPAAEDVKYPICLGGKLACPPEDCGGFWGYYEMLEVSKNPKHERYEELSYWLGENFDPDRFDLDKINKMLAKLWRKRR